MNVSLQTMGTMNFRVMSTIFIRNQNSRKETIPIFFSIMKTRGIEVTKPIVRG